MQNKHWQAIYALFDELTDLPEVQRQAALVSASGGDAELRAELLSLLRAHERQSGPLDAAPIFTTGESLTPEPDDEQGDTVGPYRLLKRIGAGGMGSVWLAERSDGVPKRCVALKLSHTSGVRNMSELMARETDILAGLEHPGIARLYEAGISECGRPYIALEFVDGAPIHDYCRHHRLSVETKLRLLLQVLNAIAFAHARFVVHQDIKPSNILVSSDGTTHLLDFGIARILNQVPNAADKSWDAGFTPEYASPEQIAGETLSAASDVYSVALVGFEMLAESRPQRFLENSRIPILRAIRSFEQPLVSTCCGAADRSLVKGDIDAIFAKALSFSVEHRYPTIPAFAEDLERHLSNKPVSARGDGLVYRAGKLLARYRWQSVSIFAALLALMVGSAAIFWQSHQTQKQAARATATKDFLVSVFRANDPRIASNKPKGEISARELLDSAATRIERELTDQPELQIELLGLIAQIYDYMAEEQRFADTQKRRMELARGFYGNAHPVVIKGLLDEIDADCLRGHFDDARVLLEETDKSISSSGRDNSELRASWWLEKARFLNNTSGSNPDTTAALLRALDLFAKFAPRSNEYATTLSLESIDQTEHGNYARAESLLKQAVSVAERAPNRDESAIADFLFNLGRSEERVRDVTAAESTFIRAEEQARRSYGERATVYWIALAFHARLLHRTGDREAADALFARMLDAIPKDWSMNGSNHWAQAIYADCLAADGRANRAVPLLESGYRYYLSHPESEFRVRQSRLRLGDAYDLAGRIAEARTLLVAAHDESVAKDPLDSQWVFGARERWARFLIDHAQDAKDLAAAELDLKVIVEKAADRPLLEVVLAHAGLARIAAARSNPKLASEEIDSALKRLESVQGVYDVRVGPMLWVLKSSAALAAGDPTGAQQWADKALKASVRYDDPTSPAIAAARTAVRVAALAAQKK